MFQFTLHVSHHAAAWFGRAGKTDKQHVVCTSVCTTGGLAVPQAAPPNLAHHDDAALRHNIGKRGALGLRLSLAPS